MKINTFIRARNKARELAEAQNDRLFFARSFLAELISVYLPCITQLPVPPADHSLAREMGMMVADLDIEMAAYLIGTTYTVMLPEDYRGRYGVFYTPPALTSRLLDLAEEAGIDWENAQVIDPACGGGAFLAPVAKRMALFLSTLTASNRLTHIETHLVGYEVDPFSAWMSQVFVEAALKDDIESAGRPLRNLVKVCDSLQTPASEYGKYNLIIGNPPYGRIKLSSEQRQYWSRSLYGHANLYGLFTDLAVRLAARDGIIAYITPTSFLGGQYFQSLRALLGREAPPVCFDFIAHREGVFADVLQEILLSVYRKRPGRRKVSVSYLSLKEAEHLTVKRNGQCDLPLSPDMPWILPRVPEQSDLVQSCRRFAYRLSDLGYTVSTGPLVWNRHKSKLFDKRTSGSIPVIWAECVNPSGNGEFTFKATARNHKPWFRPGPKDESNIVREACVLLQRTTSLEQPRRLVAAVLPQTFIDEHGGAVTVENHLNMIKPIPGQKPVISAQAVAALFNSETLDRIFRCINGSTAVSAYEIESLPFPPPEVLYRLDKLIARQAKKETIEKAIREMYENVGERAAA
jgi:adenine-specific DNA-methyltransferase